VLEVVLESVFAVTDVFFVSRLGEAAIATVGLTESMMTIVYTLAVGLSIGVTATVARRIGEHNPDAAARAAVQAIALGVGISVMLSVIGITMAPALLRLLGATDDVVTTGSGFTRIMIGGNASVVLAQFGSAALAAYTIAIRIILFALFPSWGLGNAAATMVGQGLGARDPERAEKAVWIAGFYNLLFLGTIGILFVALLSTILFKRGRWTLKAV